MADESKKQTKYIYAYGRRKTAVATVRLYEGKSDSEVNGKKFTQVFPRKQDQKVIMEPLNVVGKKDEFYFTAKTNGGGTKAQEEAIRHAISKALVKFDESFRKQLKPLGFLSRDDRMVERKKTGLKKARRAPQFSKR